MNHRLKQTAKWTISLGLFLSFSGALAQSPWASKNSSANQACAAELGITLPAIASGNALSTADRDSLYRCVRKAAHTECATQAGITPGDRRPRTDDENAKIQQCMAIKGFTGHLHPQRSSATNEAAQPES